MNTGYKARLYRATTAVVLGAVAITGVGAAGSVVTAQAGTSVVSTSAPGALAASGTVQGYAPSAQGSAVASTAATTDAPKRLRPVIDWIKRNLPAAWNAFKSWAKGTYASFKAKVTQWWNNLNAAVRWAIKLIADFSIVELISYLWSILT